MSVTKNIKITCECGTSFIQVVLKDYDIAQEIGKVYILDAGEFTNRTSKVTAVQEVKGDM